MVVEAARTPEILVKRVKRLLRLDRAVGDQNELSAKVLPFLKSIGAPALVGGAVRDIARGGRRAFTSDLDFVIHGCERRDFVNAMSSCGAEPNRFGGYKLNCFRWKVDAWHLDDTWAKTSGHVRVSEPRDIIHCTFFDWDSAIFDVASGRLLIPEDYLDRIRSNVMDVRLEANPNPAGSVIRALRRAALWSVMFGPRLAAFTAAVVRASSWAELVATDSRAFSTHVLRYLDRAAVLDRLDLAASGVSACPVPEWTPQLRLPLGEQSLPEAPA